MQYIVYEMSQTKLGGGGSIFFLQSMNFECPRVLLYKQSSFSLLDKKIPNSQLVKTYFYDCTVASKTFLVRQTVGQPDTQTDPADAKIIKAL